MLPKIFVSNSQKDLLLSPSSVRRLVREVLLFKEKQTHEVSIYFISEKKMCALHEEFFNDPSPTDCITLPMDESSDESYHILGEIFVCPKTALNYVSKKRGLNQIDVYEETSLYIVHGLLHLLGYDDIEAKDRKMMRTQERKVMSHLRHKNLLLQKSQVISPR